MAIAEVSVVPLGTKSPSVSQYVARAIKVLEQEKDLKYDMTAMGTIIEGNLDRILVAVRKMHEGIFGEGVARAITTEILSRGMGTLSISSIRVSRMSLFGEARVRSSTRMTT